MKFTFHVGEQGLRKNHTTDDIVRRILVWHSEKQTLLGFLTLLKTRLSAYTNIISIIAVACLQLMLFQIFPVEDYIANNLRSNLFRLP